MNARKISAMVLTLFTATFLMLGCDKTANCNHDYDIEVVKEATETANGVDKYVCKLCGNSYEKEAGLKKLSAQDVYVDAKSAIGEITTYNKSNKEKSLGTCFYYAKDKVITNYHVIKGANSATVKFGGDSTSVKVSGVYLADEDLDVAVLTVTKNCNNYLKTSGLTSLNVSVGSPVYAVGSSEGLTLSLSTGVVSYVDRKIDGVRYVQHTAAISHGNSGGPLFNEYGYVIGINTASIEEGQNLNFAIRIDEIKKVKPYGKIKTLAEVYNDDYGTPLHGAPYDVGDKVLYETSGSSSTSTAQKIVDNGTMIVGTVASQYDGDFYKFELYPGESVVMLITSSPTSYNYYLMAGIFYSDDAVAVSEYYDDMLGIVYKNNKSYTITCYLFVATRKGTSFSVGYGVYVVFSMD